MAQKVVGYLVVSEGASEPIGEQKVVSRSKDGPVVIEAWLQDGKKPNRNKRFYSESVLREAISTPFVQERLRTKTLYGEAGHPTEQSVQRQLSIDHTRISHIVSKMWMEDGVVMGRVETANTQCGRDMKGLIEQGSMVAFSFRGMGPIVESKKDYVEVKSPLSMCTYDWVVHPSHENAYMKKVVTESKAAGSAMSLSEGCSLILPPGALAESSPLVRQVAEIAGGDARLAVVLEGGTHASVRGKNGNAIVRLEDHVREEIAHVLNGISWL